MAALIITPNVARPDDVYQLLVDSYAGLSDDGVQRFHVRLAMLLINHIGDSEAVGQAIAAARRPAASRKPS